MLELLGFIALVYLGLGIIFGAIAGSITMITLKFDPPGLTILTGLIVMVVVAVFWLPLGAVWVKGLR